MGGGIFYGGERADDALVVGDFLVGVEGNVEVDLDERGELSIERGRSGGSSKASWEIRVEALASEHLLGSIPSCP